MRRNRRIMRGQQKHRKPRRIRLEKKTDNEQNQKMMKNDNDEKQRQGSRIVRMKIISRRITEMSEDKHNE